MRVGEQPGDREDITGGRSFGPVGHILDEALAAAASSATRSTSPISVKRKEPWPPTCALRPDCSTDLCRRALRERTTNDSRNSRLLA
jgi:uracil-DNA glycosylase